MSSWRKFARVVAVIALTGAGIALGSGAARPAPAAADTSDFSYDSWQVDYLVEADDEGRAVAHVTETLSPRFPDYDQNRGIVRGIPDDYEGASTDPRDFSVSDANGDPVPFEIEHDDGFTAVLVGDDSYVHGAQTYVIEYTLSDVILARDDGTADEFYWDLVDHEHLQRIGRFSASIAFSPEIAERLNGDARCYTGAANSTDQCTIARQEDGFSASAGELDGREGLTVAIGFEPGTFVQAPTRIPNPPLDLGPIVLGGGALAAGLGGAVATSSMKRRKRRGRGTVIAQYEVPRELPPLIAGPIAAEAPAQTVSAEILHLAVSGALRIEDGQDAQGFFGTKKARPVLRVMDPMRAFDLTDKTAMSTLFRASLEPGSAISLPKKDEEFGRRMMKLGEYGADQADERGFFSREASRPARICAAVALGLVVIAAAVAAVAALAGRSGLPVAGAVVLGIPALLLCFYGFAKHRVYTPFGAEWREYLEGVKLFIRVAEQDRLQMLQSYQGAERRQDGTVDVIHLYEKLLPYAVLFGMEKQWTEVLQVKYVEAGYTAVYWYPGVGSHGIGNVTSTISSFTSSLSSSVSYTSSSSGGSSGGGFSGGGGGGGFSGGR